MDLLSKRRLLDSARPWRLLGKLIVPLYAAMKRQFGWEDEDADALAARGAHSDGSSSGSGSGTTGSGSTRSGSSRTSGGSRHTHGTQVTHATQNTTTPRRHGSDSLSSLGSRTSAGSLMSERKRERRRAMQKRIRRRQREERRRRAAASGVAVSSSSSESGSSSESSSTSSHGSHGSPRSPGKAQQTPPVPVQPSAPVMGDTSAIAVNGRYRERWTDLARPRMARTAAAASWHHNHRPQGVPVPGPTTASARHLTRGAGSTTSSMAGSHRSVPGRGGLKHKTLGGGGSSRRQDSWKLGRRIRRNEPRASSVRSGSQRSIRRHPSDGSVRSAASSVRSSRKTMQQRGTSVSSKRSRSPTLGQSGDRSSVRSASLRSATRTNSSHAAHAGPESSPVPRMKLLPRRGEA